VSGRRLPPIPLLVFAGLDILAALLLLMGGGFSVQFWLVLLIGLVLAVLGWIGLRDAPPAD
jgi:membrane protein implicated in regulation of membrane protease activity